MKYDLLIKNAAQLITCHDTKPKRGKALHNLGLIENGAIVIHQGKIVAVGRTEKLCRNRAKELIDAENHLVMPGFVDPHTHLLFAGSRETEWQQKLSGRSYLDILADGGGIFSTVAKTREATRQSLVEESLTKLDQLLNHGTTTVEIKTGYGLSYQSEKKLLEVIEKVTSCHPIDIVKTLLSAHVYPTDNKSSQYRKELKMMIADFDYDFCDIFIEKGAFSLNQAKDILGFAQKKGKKIKIHADEFHQLGGSLLAAKLGAVSVDHLDYIESKAIKTLAQTDTIGVILPGVSLFLQAKKQPPVKQMIEAGMALALASDFNPGSCPCFNMQLIISLACMEYGLLPAQAINMATINSAFALSQQDKVGSLAVGKQADILILDVDSYLKLPYFFGVNHVETVIKKGKIIKKG